jgi:pilus assembly protein FimV
MNRIFATAAAVSLACAAAGTFALGFGRAHIGSVMGQPFDATVLVRIEAGDESPPSCVSADVFYGENRLPESAVTAGFEPGDGAQRRVRVRGSVLIDEPVVSVYLTVGCNARVTRKWVSLADPSSAQPDAALAAAPAPPAVTVPVDPAVSAEAVPAARPPAPGGPSPARVQQARRADGAASRVRASRQTAAAGPITQGPVPSSRLRLDVVDIPLSRESTLRLSEQAPAVPADEGGTQRAAAAALWRALNASPEDLLRDRQRLQELEAGFERLRDEVARSQQALAKMEARLSQPRQPAGLAIDPWILGLGFLAAVLGGALGWLAWQRWRDHLYATDWHAGSDGDLQHSTLSPPSLASVPMLAPVPPADAAHTAPPMPLAPAASTLPADDGDDTPTAGRPYVFDEAPLPVQGRAAAKPEPPPAPLPLAVLGGPVPRGRSARPMSVEELIDLEQQADFFVVLGQDEAAVDLLLAHVRNPGATTPLPYLKLLEIYQRRGEHIEYERVRKHFNAQFKTSAPAWDEDLEQGPWLDDYPSVMGRLQQVWTLPEQALETLRASLVDRAEPAKPFTLPAYRELLLLYAIARDLAERDEGGVDVLLPLDDVGGVAQGSVVSAWVSLGSEDAAAAPRRREPGVAVSAPSASAPRSDTLSLEATSAPGHRSR